MQALVNFICLIGGIIGLIIIIINWQLIAYVFGAFIFIGVIWAVFNSSENTSGK